MNVMMLKMECLLEAYVSREIPRVFAGHTLVATNETLPGHIAVDFHLRDKNNVDVFVELSKRKFFGYRLERVFDAEFYMAEPEKSLVDSFDKPHYAGGIEQLARIVWRGLARVDQNKLVNYAISMKSRALVQRLGFVIDFLSKENLVEPLPLSLRNLLQDNVGRTPIYLDLRKPKAGSFYKEWRVVCNMSRDQLLSEIEVR